MEEKDSHTNIPLLKKLLRITMGLSADIWDLPFDGVAGRS